MNLKRAVASGTIAGRSKNVTGGVCFKRAPPDAFWKAREMSFPKDLNGILHRAVDSFSKIGAAENPVNTGFLKGEGCACTIGC